ncbi:IS200/IS605 family transposase [bacterium]|nr:MAG: IS200/IS605 family transposase [bacterium]QQR61735.1 MAG: IS200/IS605 family transposase [bacterium]QQR62697.1 MAG: IS200/IS605 family transposase [bacterium]
MYHIVWIPKYRKKVLEGSVKIELERLLREIVVINGWAIQELNIQIDHVHLVIQLPPSVSVSKVVQLLKGTTSRMLRQQLPEIKKYLWGNDFWSDGSFCETVGQCIEEAIRKYVCEQ